MKTWRKLLAVLLIFGMLAGTTVVTEAAVPTAPKGSIQVEPYYEKLRKAFFLAGYEEAGACNGWVERVIHKSGLVGDFVVGGTVQELNEAMAKSPKFKLVASLEGGQSGYQEATDRMIRDVNAGKIKAGDIIIYTKNMKTPDSSGVHWLHAAIAMKELFDGTVVNYANSGPTRWKTGYIGYPTIGHALAPIWGVEYNTPMTTPSTQEADDGGSTGYYVYRIVTGADDDGETGGETGEETGEPGADETRWEEKDGSWYFYRGTTPETGWVKDGGKWYFLDESGMMRTGWVKDAGKWYYLRPNGSMQTGWRKIDNVWYFFRPDGSMQTGWRKIGGVWYFFRPGGAMQKGWKKISGIWYFFLPDGGMHTGWRRIGGKWYYMDENGAMVTGEREIGSISYTFDEEGVCLNPDGEPV